MAAGGSSFVQRQAWYLETIEEGDEPEAELEDSVLLCVRRRSRAVQVKQSTPAHTEESSFTISCSNDSSGAFLPQRAHHPQDLPQVPLPSLLEADDAPDDPDQSQPPGSPVHPLGESSAGVISAVICSHLGKDDDAENKAEDWPEPAESKMKKQRKLKRKLAMRSEDGEAPAVPAKKKGRKPRKNEKTASSVVPEWLAILMHSIEAAAHHELVIE